MKLSFDGKVYRNTGTEGSPTWDEVPNIIDLSVNHEKDEADATTRANGGWEAVVGSIKKAPLEFNQIRDPADTDWEAIRAAYFGNTNLDLAIADAAIASDGTTYFRAEFTVLKWTDNQQLREVMGTSVTCKPTYSTLTPSWNTVSA